MASPAALARRRARRQRRPSQGALDAEEGLGRHAPAVDAGVSHPSKPGLRLQLCCASISRTVPVLERMTMEWVIAARADRGARRAAWCRR